ncbi:MAG: NAD(P)-dependent alcohol dehydrogenase, partial [Proteobacteria bacterium]|nr:NAD(P)-dependent alcohol dehydrogenase [Pseudomonadota bacterium]
MILTKSYATLGPKGNLGPFQFERRSPRENDVVIDILYCGVCHSDIHQARDEWGGSIYPMVPGHEIVGTVSGIGKGVSYFNVGDTVGVGCLVDSCRECPSCHEGLEQYCEGGMVPTYNSMERDGSTPTFGGYSNKIVVREEFVLKIDPKLNLAATAPLLCAGITTYSPLRHWDIQKGKKVGIVGLGGLGHMGVKFSQALGAETVVFTTSESKKSDALRLGANQVVLSKHEAEMQTHQNSFDFILDTISAPHDVNPYLQLLKRDGSMVLVGVPTKPMEVSALNLIFSRKSLSGSLIGGIKETQEMLDFCARHQIVSDVEVIPIQKINE